MVEGLAAADPEAEEAEAEGVDEPAPRLVAEPSAFTHLPLSKLAASSTKVASIHYKK